MRSGQGFLSVGCDVLVELVLRGEKTHHFRTFVRGWNAGEYVLLDWPKSVAEAKPIRINTQCIVRTLCDGVVTGFSTTIVDCGVPMFRQIRVEWPRETKTLRLRKHERIPLGAACRLILSTGVYAEAVMADIAIGGCSIECDMKLAKGDEIVVTIPLSAPGSPESVRAIVRNVTPQNAGIRVGLEFVGLEESDRLCLETAIRHRIRETRAPHSQRVEALVFAQEDDSAGTVVEAIRSAGLSAKHCSTLVEGFYYTLALRPRSVVISDALCTLSELEICRIIAKGPRCEGTHFFVKERCAAPEPGDADGGNIDIRYYSDYGDLTTSLRALYAEEEPENILPSAGDEVRLNEAAFQLMHAVCDASN